MSNGIIQKLRTAYALNVNYSKRGLAYYLDRIIVPSSPEPNLLSLVADDWQREMLGPMIPAFEHLAGMNDGYAGPMQFLQILARGHSKSSLEAWLACWELMASKRTIHGYILAADRDQGRLIIQAAQDFIRLNPWVPVTIKRDVFTGPAGEVEVLPFDASSSMGLRGNLYILDEIVHWKRQAEWTALVTGLGKVTPCLLAVMSNAGLLDTWQHDVYLEACADPKTWEVFHREGTLASWLDKAKIARDRKLIPPSEAKRLFDNKWIDAAEEFDYLTRPECEACEPAGMDLIYRLRKQVGHRGYVVSVDYGPKRDRTALCVAHVHANRVIIDRLDVWQGSPDAPIQIEAVEAWLDEVERSFSPVLYVVDGYQMEGTAQKLEKSGRAVERYNFRGGAGNYELAQHLRAVIVEKRVTWYPGAGTLQVTDKRTGRVHAETLVDELAGLRTKRMSYGFRFDHETQKHDDRAFVIALASLRALDYAEGRIDPVRPQAAKPVVITDDVFRRPDL